ncbi:MAG TPA: hypothetical protein DCK93_11405 [Blastocatellia bacterium]|nr:hypothetical protein [Blastocatellia bacterium]
MSLEHWIKKLPEFDVPEWLERFRSKDNPAHLGAFFKLYTRALLGHQGFAVQREPPTKTSKLPDFLAHQDGQGSFIVECTFAAGDEWWSPTQRRQDHLSDMVNRLK